MHSVFIEEINKITLSSQDDTRMQILQKHIYMKQALISEKEEIKCHNIIK